MVRMPAIVMIGDGGARRATECGSPRDIRAEAKTKTLRHSFLLHSSNVLSRMAGASRLHLRLGHDRRGGGLLRDAPGIGRWRLSATPALRQRRTLAARTSRCVPHNSEAYGALVGVCHLWLFLGRNWYAFREQLNSVEALWLKWDRISTFVLACAAAAFLARSRER